MPMSEIDTLIDEYKNELTNGNITNDRLLQLINDPRFKQSEGYSSTSPLSDTNYSRLQAMQYFVSVIAHNMPADKVHTITERCIDLTATPSSPFMVEASLARAFYTYERAEHPQSANKHNLDGGIIKNKNITIPASTNTALSKDVDFFQKNIVVQGQFIKKKELGKKVHDLKNLCDNYYKHLEKAEAKGGAVSNKITVVKQMQAVFTDDGNDKDKLERFQALLTEENINTLTPQRNNSIFARFKESLMHIVTVGLVSKATKGTFTFWKSHGQAAVDQMKDIVDKTSLKR